MLSTSRPSSLTDFQYIVFALRDWLKENQVAEKQRPHMAMPAVTYLGNLFVAWVFCARDAFLL